MRRWLEEGRVSADSLVWREGWPDWKPAGPVFPSLEVRERPASNVSHAADAAANEFAFTTDATGGKHLKGRTPSRSQGRNVAIVVTLTIVCVALLVALSLVLRGHG